MADAGVSLGKGAWDCDTGSEIPPEKEASDAQQGEGPALSNPLGTSDAPAPAPE
jgi:hypothetical protein